MITPPDGYTTLVRSAGFLADAGAGQFEATGGDATACINRVVTADLSLLEVGRGTPTLLLRDDGSILAQLTVYRFDDRIMLVTDQLTRTAVWDELVARKRGQVRLRDISDDTALIRVRGPQAPSLLAPTLVPQPAEAGAVMIARCGATDVFAARTLADGPEGFDLHCRRRDQGLLVTSLVAAGITVVSALAWEVHRIEWGLAMVGVEIDATDTPLEVGLEDLVKEGKGAPFPGEVAVASRRRTGPIKRLVGVRIRGAETPPVGANVRVGGLDVERLRSVAVSPRLGTIGIIAVPSSAAAVGTAVVISSNGSSWDATVARRPFVSRATA